MWHIYVRDGKRFVYHSSQDGRSARLVREAFLNGHAGRRIGRAEDVRVSRTPPATHLPLGPYPSDTAMLDWLLARLYRVERRGHADLWEITGFISPSWDEVQQGPPNLRVVLANAMQAFVRPVRQDP